MLGDEAQPAESERSRDRAASGPRHAAPRKSLLTKLHVPAGKAVALAAMPTAVLMGMGLTPHLAQADEMPENPYKSGPCVTQSDTATPKPSATGTDKPATPADTATPKPSASPSASPTRTPAEPAPSPSPAEPDPEPTATAPVTGLLPDSGTAAEESVSPSPSPSATQSTPSFDPLDPLGIGNLLGGLLGVDDAGTASPAPTTPAPAPTAPATPDPGTSPAPTAPADAADPAKDAAQDAAEGTVKGTAEDTAKKTGDAARKAVKDTAGATATPEPSGTATTGSAAPDGKTAYPCPAYDAQALADADVEQGIPLLADTPWILKSTKLTLYGLSYEGIVEVRLHNGTVKPVLKFTATGVDIENLHQIVDGSDGTTIHVTSRPGSTSTIRNGTVTMYTESLSGNLLGAVPVTFTPKAPPPLTLPVLFFTDVTVVQAAQFGGDLHVPGMHVKPNEPA